MLLGIVAPVKDYRLKLAAEPDVGVCFRVNNDIEIQLTKSNVNIFLVFMNMLSFRLLWFITYTITSTTENTCCLEFKHLDFLWLIKVTLLQQKT